MKLKEDKIKKPGGVLDSSPSRTSGDKEKDELRKTIRRLEDRLQAVNRPEKPLEEGLPASEESNEKQVDVNDCVSTDPYLINVNVFYGHNR